MTSYGWISKNSIANKIAQKIVQNFMFQAMNFQPYFMSNKVGFLV